MTHIHTTTHVTTPNNPSAHSQIKNYLLWLKECASSTTSYVVTTGIQSARYLGVKSVQWIKDTPQMTHSAYLSAKSAATDYLYQRTPLHKAIDLTALTALSLVGAKLISSGPSQILHETRKFVALKILDFLLIEDSITVVSDYLKQTPIAKELEDFSTFLKVTSAVYFLSAPVLIARR